MSQHDPGTAEHGAAVTYTPRFLWEATEDVATSRRWRRAMVGSLVLHTFLFGVSVPLKAFRPLERPGPVARIQRTRLYLPPSLIRKDSRQPNAARQVTLADLSAPHRPDERRPLPPQRPRPFRLPAQTTPAGNPARNEPQIVATPPSLKAENALPVLPGATPSVATVPPPDANRNPFERAGSQPAPANTSGPMATPNPSVRPAVRDLARRPGGSHLAVSDEGALPQTPDAPPLPDTPRMGGRLELESDPMGADFRPYLRQILAIVRRNWFTVIPESVRLGLQRGRTTIQFTVVRNGSIPKLIISEASGAASLDRAAVAGLSMSNPLPPLPSEYHGAAINLAFSFSYNVAPAP